jgi:signal recognition particle subunit SRP19
MIQMRNKKQFHIFPVYFDADRTRGQGRRVKKKSAIKNPSITELAEAATALGLSFEVDLEAKYPRYFWIPSGRLKVKKQDPYNKNKLIRKLASNLRKNRAQK